MSETRFGAALTVVGDLNKDGFAGILYKKRKLPIISIDDNFCFLDLVVGAPYHNENQGVVYLYLGSKDGLNEKFSQVIDASEIDRNLRGFGSSFSRGLDIDNNNYNGRYLYQHNVLVLLFKFFVYRFGSRSLSKWTRRYIKIAPNC